MGDVIKHWVKDSGKEVRHQHPPQADHWGSQDSLVPEDNHQSNRSSEQGTPKGRKLALNKENNFLMRSLETEITSGTQENVRRGL